MRRTRPSHGATGPKRRIVLPALEGCESGRIGSTGNAVWRKSPWVQIPPSPLIPGVTRPTGDHCQWPPETGIATSRDAERPDGPSPARTFTP